MAYGLDATCLRYANVYGERQNPHGEAGVVAIFHDRLLAGQAPTINGDGLQTRDYVHVSDVVRANLAAAGLPGFHIYNVGTGVETTVVELYREIARALGSDAEATHGPAKPGEQQRSVIDAGRLRRELGLPEPLPLREGLARTAAWFRERRRWRWCEKRAWYRSAGAGQTEDLVSCNHFFIHLLEGHRNVYESAELSGGKVLAHGIKIVGERVVPGASA